MIPCVDHFRCVDMRTVSFDVPPQEVNQISWTDLIIPAQPPQAETILINTLQILSRDSVTVTVDAVVYFNVVTAELALCSVDDYRCASMSTLRQIKSELETYPSAATPRDCWPPPRCVMCWAPRTCPRSSQSGTPSLT